jgi:ATP-dependent DNA ligase
MLMRDRRIAVCFVAFDLLAIDGTPTLEQPYSERRTILEAIDFAGPRARLPGMRKRVRWARLRRFSGTTLRTG